MNQEKIEAIAKLCHEINKIYCECIGDYSQVHWEDAPEWQKESCINGVVFHLTNDATPEETHENWLKEKLAAGWVYGKEKDPAKKTHPCIMRYDQLPKRQQTKDRIFKGICDVMKEYINEA